MKNRFNRLTSKEWLPFQKSWFKYDTEEKLLTENIRFFIREDETEEKVFYYRDILTCKLILLPETFWCQDDINLATYGYGKTFVSNTFHQYCLNFQKP